MKINKEQIIFEEFKTQAEYKLLIKYFVYIHSVVAAYSVIIRISCIQ